MEQQKQQLKIKAKDEDLKGVYSNLMQIVHAKEEFILDFFMASPPQGILASRVIMSPGHLKRMLKALQEKTRHANIDVLVKHYIHDEEPASPYFERLLVR